MKLVVNLPSIIYINRFNTLIQDCRKLFELLTRIKETYRRQGIRNMKNTSYSIYNHRQAYLECQKSLSIQCNTLKEHKTFWTCKWLVENNIKRKDQNK